ncbi:MAG: EcsC family protein, partial [Sinobacteraceae bacterium]|nr:EcsC family protein [Nevskiaceae bacterium]
VAGGVGLAADIPALLVIAFRSIHRVGLCYGEDCMTGQEQLPLAVFALASANNDDEKRAAWDVIRMLDANQAADEVSARAVRGSALRAANQGVVKSTAVLGFNRVARQLSLRLGWCLAGGAIPLAGAFIGASVNAWYLREVSQAAQHVFQWRWLAARYPGQMDAGPVIEAWQSVADA